MRILATCVIVTSFISVFSLNSEAQAASSLDQNTKQNTKIQLSKTDIDSKDQNIDVIVPKNERMATWQDNVVLALYIPDIAKKKNVSAKSTSRSMQLPNGDFMINASAYTAAADECGKSDGITASGKRVTEGRTLACPKTYSFGTQIEIDGMGSYTCEDRGGAIKGNHFDIYMKTKAQAFAFGRRNLVARVVK